jgi:hypothetical protein
MASETIKIVHQDNKSTVKVPFIGTKTNELIKSLPIDDNSKETLITEAMDILSHCIFPTESGNVTNIAVGYVQSGKTMSFTTLTALAADNGFRVIIYLTGTKTNLQDQTYKRLRKDLNVIKNFDTYKIFDDNLSNKLTDIQEVLNFLEEKDYTLLFPILKHAKHIQTLADIFSSTSIAPLMSNEAVLIIDDEADQSSFNTYARKNADAPDWEEDAYSATYDSILALKEAFPRHSYIQYTATPQAAFLIDNNDVLSPEYHTVLTPGETYTGGKFFFKSTDRKYVIQIPDNETYHWKYRPLTERPESLDESMLQFLVSVAVVVFIQKRKEFLSMMVHVDGRTDTNEKFALWLTAVKQEWKDQLHTPDNDPSKTYFRRSLSKAYEEITKYVIDRPSLDEVIRILPKVILHTRIHLVQGGEDNDIKWEEAKGHVLVGADMLNRGFTIENLSMTYMPRTTKGKSTADTIEQRCRFFGYKQKYADVVRIYLPEKSIEEFNAYVDHEEILRTNLKQCKSVAEFQQQSQLMIISNILNPTRKNILTKKLVENKLKGWRQLRSVSFFEENSIFFVDLINHYQPVSTLEEDYRNENRNHRSFYLSIEEFCAFFKNIQYRDVPNIARKIATIQYLQFLKESGKCISVKMYIMAYAIEKGRQRKLNFINGKVHGPINLQMGDNRGGNIPYPGDKHFKSETEISVQIHKICIDDPGVKYGNKIMYNLAIYYPETLAQGYVNFAKDDDDDDD